ERSHFALRSFVEHETLRCRIIFAVARGASAGHPQHSAAGFGPDDQISFAVESQHANVSFIAGIEQLTLAVRCNCEDLSFVTSRDIQRAVRTEFEVPDVFALGVEENRLFPCRRNAVNLAVRRRAHIERASAIEGDGLSRKFTRLENRRGLSV